MAETSYIIQNGRRLNLKDSTARKSIGSCDELQTDVKHCLVHAINELNDKFNNGGAQGEPGEDGKDGKDGKDGVTFTPSVTSDGILSWTNDGGLNNPNPVNIMGPKGDTGATGEQGPQGIQGIQGIPGEKGDKGDKGATGAQGYSFVTSVSRPSFTEANWTTYGEVGHEENWSNTESIRNGCRNGDIFTIVGTATDTGNSHVLYYRCINSSGTLRGTCIAHSIALRGATGATGPQGPQGETGPQGPQGPAGSGANITVDSALSSTSTNPVQNKVVNSALSGKLSLSGGTMTGTLTVNGGDKAGGSKIVFETGKGQITNSATGTLFGYTASDTLSVGHSSCKTAIRGSGTRPTYNGSEVALLSDVSSGGSVEAMSAATIRSICT